MNPADLENSLEVSVMNQDDLDDFISCGIHNQVDLVDISMLEGENFQFRIIMVYTMLYDFVAQNN